MLLVGGGYVTATYASYWCGVFCIAYAVGLIFPGYLVYQSAKKQSEVAAREPSFNMQDSRYPSLLLIAVFVGSVVLGSAIFRSDFLATSAGSHIFTIFEAVAMAQLIPLGLALYFNKANGANCPAS